MKKVTKDLDVVDLKAKQKLLEEMNRSDLLELFKKNYKNSYKPIEPKQISLDHQISISIAKDEKIWFSKELSEIKKMSNSQSMSVSAFIRSKSIGDIDIREWEKRAKKGLEILNSEEYNERRIKKEITRYNKLLDDIDFNDEDKRDNEFFYNTKIKELEDKLEEIKRIRPNRRYRISSRVTFNEASLIKWRAARLSLPVSEYMRLLIFNYYPFSEADKHLSIDDRKRLYISILDVAQNGWGEPPKVNECPNCARYLNDIKILKEQLERIKTYTRNANRGV